MSDAKMVPSSPIAQKLRDWDRTNPWISDVQRMELEVKRLRAALKEIRDGSMEMDAKSEISRVHCIARSALREAMTGKTVSSFMQGMFGPVTNGKHEFRGEFGFPGANPNCCEVPDGMGGDRTHLCGKRKNDPVHS